MPGTGDALREGLRLGPLGIPVRVQTADPEGMGDRSSLDGSTVFVPSGDPASVPHETLHANLRQVENVVPGGTLAEILASKASEAAYGDQSQYLNPFERIAYAFQEGKTGAPDAGYQAALEADKKKPGGVLRALLGMGGKAADVAGRTLGRIQR